MSEFDFRCGPLLSAGTASVSLPWQRVCRRCSQRTVLVDQPLTLCLRLLVTLRSMLPRHKGTKKFIQVVPSLRGLQTRAGAGAALTRPTENLLFPQDKEDFGSVTSHEENWFVFSRSQRSSAPNAMLAKEIHEDSSGKAKTIRPHSERSLRVRRLIASPRKA